MQQMSGQEKVAANYTTRRQSGIPRIKKRRGIDMKRRDAKRRQRFEKKMKKSDNAPEGSACQSEA